MVYVAYTLQPLSRGLSQPSVIESAAVYRDSIILGTRQGQLLTFCVGDNRQNSASYVPLENGRMQLGFTDLSLNKTFSRKPVNQLTVIEEHEILLSLSDSLVSVYSLSENLLLLQQFEDQRGASIFACGIQHVEIQRPDNEDANDVSDKCSHVAMVKLCIAVRKKLYFFYWKPKARRFIDYPYVHTVCDVPRALMWTGDVNLIIGFKVEYISVRLSSLCKLAEICATGKQSEPCLVRLRNNEFGLLQDKDIIVVESTGKRKKACSVKLSSVPICMAYDHPYLVTIGCSIEINTVSPQLGLQGIELVQSLKPHILLPWKSGKIFAVSSNSVWCLVRSSIADQMAACKANKLFNLALELTDLMDVGEDSKALCKYHIQNLRAFELFSSKQFENAFQLFNEIQTDPLHVIGLFPTLLKDRYRKVLHYPGPIPDLGQDLERALTALLTYLKRARGDIITQQGDSVKVGGLVEGTNSIRPKKHLLQIIDTTILKCYLQTNPGLVASLLRFKDNQCHLEESETALLQKEKFEELVILYEQKGEHRKALQLLSEQAHIPSSPLHGHKRIIAYLQKLSAEHLELIFEFAKWVIAAFPDDGLQIFTEEGCDRHLLPRDAVVQFLSKESSEVMCAYLEHILLTWNDDNVLFHNMLIHKYRERILRKAREEGESLSSPCVMQLREKLVAFLQKSSRYTKASFPQYFLNDQLYHECAVVMGKLSHHQEALTIYLHVLNDFVRAEEYCVSHYARHRPSDCDVFVILLQLYVTPAEICIKALNIGASPRIRKTSSVLSTSLHDDCGSVWPDLLEVISLLLRNIDKFDLLRVIELLPEEWPLNRLVPLLSEALNLQATRLAKVRFENALLQERYYELKGLLLQEKPIVIYDCTLCDLCQRRINRSVFVVTESGQLVHYACHKRIENELHD